MYTSASHNGGAFDIENVDERSGFVQILISGERALETFIPERGGHRWQRVPPTERRGRVQTSTVTVAVLEALPEQEQGLLTADVEITATRGSGPGGQNRNKVASCIVAKHVPSGISVRVDSERSQHQNKRIAMVVLTAKVKNQVDSTVSAQRAHERKLQVGSGMRGDKVRTYRVADDHVVDHRTGKRWRLCDWLDGKW